MNKLNDAWQALQKLPPEEQEHVANAILDLAARTEAYRLTEEQAAEVRRRIADKDAPTMTLDEFRAKVRQLGQ
jgi:putative addiction module component (TIGR02574 family)